jgi:hypothetical protein
LTIVTDPLNSMLTQLFGYAPRLLAGGALILVAWLVATVLRLIVNRALGATQLDEKLSAGAGMEEDKRVPLSASLADSLYWLVFLLFLPAILGALAMDGLLVPVQGMMDKLLAYLPNLVAAGVTLLAGWFLAKVLRKIISNLLAASGLNALGERVGLKTVLGSQKLSDVLGLVVYTLVLVPVLIASLNALGLDSLTAPASNMLNTILEALPSLFGAALVLVITYVLARVVVGLVTNLLAGVGFDRILVKLGIGREPAETDRTPSEVAGSVVLVVLMLFATVEALDLLGFASLGGIVMEVLTLAGHIALGLVIFGLGLFLANLAAKAVGSSGSSQSWLLALMARVAILVLTGAMALRQMGLANEIIILAFGLIVGAIAVAAAIAFGIGGREIASRHLEKWTNSL